MKARKKFSGVFLIENKLFTMNSIKGFRPFREELVEIDKTEYRSWDPNRSKVAAAIMKGLKELPIENGNKILYLGAAHGFTISFLRDIVGKNGIIYAVEFSDRCFKELLPLCEKYKNIVPILADARKPEEYSWIEKVDVVYCDIAQPDQTEIAIRNCKMFLKKNNHLFLAIKARSIDVTRDPEKITQEEIKKLKSEKFEIIDWKMLDPYEKDHGFVLARY